MLTLKLSIYTFNDLKRCYGIVQFGGKEVGKFREKVGNMEIAEAKKHVENALNVKIRSFSLAQGKLLYGNQMLEMVYLRIETDDNDEYFFEVYDESMYASSNTDVMTLYRKVISMAKYFIGDIELPKSKLIGFTG